MIVPTSPRRCGREFAMQCLLFAMQLRLQAQWGDRYDMSNLHAFFAAELVRGGRRTAANTAVPSRKKAAKFEEFHLPQLK